VGGSSVRLGAALVVLAVGFAGCGGGSSSKSTAATKLDIQIEEFGENTEISVPKQLEAGVVEVQFSNDGQKDHSAQILRYDEGHTPQQALKVSAKWGEGGEPLPEWVHLVGGFGSAGPGESRSSVLKLEPGSYAVVDIESPASKPAYGTFGVTGKPSKDELPPTDGAIKAAEYSFSAAGLVPGSHRVLFDNTGQEPHHIVAAPIKRGSTIEDVRRAVRDEGGEPPIDEKNIQDYAIVDGGSGQVLELDLKPGKYALLCFIPDRKGGPPHAVKGMVSEAVVK
jgi:hypothetical protein